MKIEFNQTYILITKVRNIAFGRKLFAEAPRWKNKLKNFYWQRKKLCNPVSAFIATFQTHKLQVLCHTQRLNFERPEPRNFV